jgi:hypothetical protein
MFAVQGTHAPSSQTLFVPQDVPLPRFPLSVQTDAPLEHTVAAVWQAFDDVHDTPAVHGTQLPLSQTLFVPQDVPLSWFPLSVQTAAPLEHTVAAV